MKLKKPFGQNVKNISGGQGHAKSRLDMGGEGLAPGSAPKTELMSGRPETSESSRSPAGRGEKGRSDTGQGSHNEHHVATSSTEIPIDQGVYPVAGELDYRPVDKSHYNYLEHFAKPAVLKAGHNTMSKAEAFHEVHANTPKMVKH